MNLAARLAARADPSQVRVPVELLEHSRAAWQHADRVALPLKGIREPVVTVALGQPQVAAVDAGSTVMVGRAQELTQIRAALDRLGGLQGGSLIVTGEPGMGKTRLVAEVVSEADDFRVLSAQCGHSGANTPYAVVRTLLGAALGLHTSTPPAEGLALATSLLADLDPEMVERVPLLAAVFDVALPDAEAKVQALGEEFRTEALQRLVVDVLRAVLLRPTLLVVEDTHLMDGDSGRLLDQLLARADDRPWLLLTTRRDAPAGWTAPYGEVIRLGPLDPAACQSMTEVVLPERPLPPAAAQALVARAGGHPLFLRELVLAASRGDQLDELPLSVEELVTVQIDALSTVPRGLLRRAAVLGDSFPESLLQELVADGSDVVGRLPLREQLRDLDTFLVPEPRRRWRFRHTVHREAAYAGLPVRVRAGLHARVGDVLARSPDNVARRPEVMARHYFAAGRFHDAWVCARLAGAKAMDHAAPEAAAQAFAQAAEAGARSGTVAESERAADVEAWADALFLCGRSTESDRAYAQARGLVSGVPGRVAALALKRAKVAQRQGRYPVALRRTATGIRALEGVDGTEALATRARLLARRSVIQMSQGRYSDAGSSARGALELARRAGQEDAMAQAHLVLHGVEVFTGARTQEDHGAAALRIFQELGDLSGQAHAHNNLAMRLLLRGDWPQALERFQLAATSFEEVGDAANAANAAYNSADLLNRQGRSAEALSVLAGVLRIARAVDDEELYALALREQGRAHVRAGRGSDGMGLLDRARELFHELHEPHEVCDTDIALAEGHLLGADPAQALACVDDALVVARRLGAVTLLPSGLRVRACAQAELGDEAGARDSLAQGLAASAAPELAHERGFLLAVAVHLGPNGSTAGADEASAALAALGVVRAPLPWAEWGAPAQAVAGSGHG